MSYQFTVEEMQMEMPSLISQTLSNVVAAVETARNATTSTASSRAIDHCVGLFSKLVTVLHCRTTALRFNEAHRRMEVLHLQEQTLTTPTRQYCLAASPWNEDSDGRWCCVGIGEEGTLSSVYKLHEFADCPRQLVIVHGYATRDLSEALADYFNARLA